MDVINILLVSSMILVFGGYFLVMFYYAFSTCK